eukprot:scaffold124873_cov30-Tisochrysis_lutea.AAC.4
MSASLRAHATLPASLHGGGSVQSVIPSFHTHTADRASRSRRSISLSSSPSNPEQELDPSP